VFSDLAFGASRTISREKENAMSNVEDRLQSLEERRALQERYLAARAKIEKNRRIEAGQSAALMFAALAYGDVLDNNRPFALMSHWAKLFCIAAAFVIPNLLMLKVLM
jgi:ferric-dicitrate binding protein FerR (iron transport regulator)